MERFAWMGSTALALALGGCDDGGTGDEDAGGGVDAGSSSTHGGPGPRTTSEAMPAAAPTAALDRATAGRARATAEAPTRVGAARPRRSASSGYLDYVRKRGGFGLELQPEGDVRADMDRIRAFYADEAGKYPERFGPVRLRDETAA